MFDSRSRYSPLATLEHMDPDGRTIVYVTRRFIPPAHIYVVAGGVTITDSDRIDLIAYRAHGTPAGFWQIADANEATHPEELTARAGRRLVIPVPRAPEA
jgi:hypothetical protein